MNIPVIATSLTKFGDLWDKGIDDLIREVGNKALSNAGLKPNDVNCVYVANAFSSKTNGLSMLGSIAFEELGIANAVCINDADASGAAAIKEAANSIISGQNEIVMVLGVEKVTDFKTNEIMSLGSDFLSMEESLVGATLQSQFAMITKRYLHDFRLKESDLSFIPSKNHSNAVPNEHAQYRFELSEEKIDSSPMLSNPIRMLDCAPFCDGAAALVMCSGNAAKRLGKKSRGNLLASSSAISQLSLSKRMSITSIESTAKASKNAFEAAGISQKDIDLLEVHDIVPISEVLSIEDMGFAKKGRGIKFIKSNLRKINPSGGLKACGHAFGATGVRQAVEIVNRLKSNNLKYGITHTLGGTGGIAVVNIFGAG